MTSSKSTKRALFSSALAILMCVAMLIGTTFAWFTDTASTAVNKIQAGNLDVALEVLENDQWVNAEGKTLSFLQKQADGSLAQNPNILWEPGCTYVLPELRVVNNGNLALKYEIMITGIVGDTGLNEVIDWSYDGLELNAYGVAVGSLDAGEEGNGISISGHMQEDAGNGYQGLSIDGVAVTVRATQMSKESDSFGSNYDDAAVYPEWPIVVNRTVAKDDSGNITDQVLTEYADDNTSILAQATVPAEAVKSTSSNMLFSVKETTVPTGFTIGSGLGAAAYEIKLDGLKDGNTVPVITKIFVGKNLMGVTLTHNASDVFTAVGSADEVDADKEFYYDSTTGLITFATVSFSPFTVTYKMGAAVGEKTYLSLDDAVKALKDGETVKMLADYNGILELNGKKNIVFDFNGNTVNGTIAVGCKYSSSWGFSNKGEASSVTFKDSKGNGGVTTDYSYGALVAAYGSDVTVDGGNFVQTYAKGSSGYSNAVTVGKDATLTVNGGYIHNNASVGNYNRVINVNNDGVRGTVTINGGKFEGTQKCGQNGWYGSYSYLIASNTSDDVFDVQINGGEFIGHTSYSYLTQVYGNVVVNDCTLTSEHSQVFDIKTGSTVTVKGGTYTINEGSNPHLAGFAYCNKNTSNAYGYVKGSLILDPVKEIKINTTTHATILSDCGVKATKGTDGYYTISR